MTNKDNDIRYLFRIFVGLFVLLIAWVFTPRLLANIGIVLTIKSIAGDTKFQDQGPSAILLSPDKPGFPDSFAELTLQRALSYSHNLNNAHRYLGLLYLRQGRSVEARSSLGKANIRSSSYPFPCYWLGFLLLRNESIEEAIDEWAQCGASGGLLEIAEHMYEQQNEGTSSWYALAVNVAQKSQPPRKDVLGRAYHRLGEMSRAQEDLPAAIAYFERALKALPERSDYRYDLSNMYATIGDFPSAIKHLRIELEMNPGNLAACGLLGEIYLQLEKEKIAEEILLNCQNLIGENYWQGRVSYDLSILYCSNGLWEKCINSAIIAMGLLYDTSIWETVYPIYFKTALDAHPENKEWYLIIGEAYHANGMTSEAWKYYDNAAKRWPSDPEIQRRLKGLGE